MFLSNPIKAIIGCAPILSFIAGGWIASMHYQREQAKYEAHLQAHYAELLEERDRQTRELQEQAYESAQEAQDEVRRIQERHAQVLDHAMRIVREYYDADILQHTSGLAGSEGNLPDTAAAPAGDSGVSPCPPCICKCPQSDGAGISRLLARQLSLAKECDEQNTRLRQVINMYQNAVAEVNR